ncbi:MAG: aldo/keto reductase [Verrucomicrobiales bacterium]|jgi:predicted aldo/keto reductase-like oxidoreductase|nr:aldo/keto reductase [Verrucomicrobiales bacterium]
MKNSTNITRKDFLKLAGAGTLAAGAMLTTGCKPRSRVTGSGGAVGEVPVDRMTYRVNPHTGDRVSLLGYGCMRFPLRQKADGSGEEIDQDIVNELVDYAIAHGVNYFDTAPVYIRGWSETAMGIALKRHPRDKFFIATKLSNQRDDPGLRSFEGSVNLYRQSFKNLQVDYLDYYLLHTVGNGGMKTFKERFIENGMVDFLLKEKAAGRIRNLGWSYHGDIAAFDYLLAQDIQWDFAQIQLNYQDWRHVANPTRDTNAEYLYGELVKHNVPAIIMEPLLGGRLARVPAQALALMKAAHPAATPAQWAFRYAGTPEHVLTVLSGMTYMEHLQENIRTYAPLVPLNEQEYATLEKVTGILIDAAYIQCTECQYCMPCPYGLDIPGTFAHYNRCVSAGQMLKTSRDRHYRTARREFLLGYDRSVPKLRQADHCTGCEICRQHCPQRIHIPQEMRRINRYAENLKQRLDF